MKDKRLYMRIQGDLLRKIDEQAKRVRRTRSEYIRMVLELAVESAEEAEREFEKERG